MVLNESQIVKENADLVRAIARKYSSYGVAFEDLVQEGYIGLLLAARKWRADGGASLRTYAALRIMVQIRRYIGVDSADRVCPPPSHASLDASLGDARDADTLHDLLPSSSRTPEELFSVAEDSAALHAEIEKLSEREREIIRIRLTDSAQTETGAATGLCRQRVQQIEARAIRTLSRRMRSSSRVAA